MIKNLLLILFGTSIINIFELNPITGLILNRSSIETSFPEDYYNETNKVMPRILHSVLATVKEFGSNIIGGEIDDSDHPNLESTDQNREMLKRLINYNFKFLGKLIQTLAKFLSTDAWVDCILKNNGGTMGCIGKFIPGKKHIQKILIYSVKYTYNRYNEDKVEIDDFYVKPNVKIANNEANKNALLINLRNEFRKGGEVLLMVRNQYARQAVAKCILQQSGDTKACIPIILPDNDKKEAYELAKAAVEAIEGEPATDEETDYADDVGGEEEPDYTEESDSDSEEESDGDGVEDSEDSNLGEESGDSEESADYGGGGELNGSGDDGESDAESESNVEDEQSEGSETDPEAEPGAESESAEDEPGAESESVEDEPSSEDDSANDENDLNGGDESGDEDELGGEDESRILDIQNREKNLVQIT